MGTEKSAEVAERERLREALVRTEQALDAERKVRVEAEALLAGLQRMAIARSLERIEEEMLETARDVFRADATVLLVDEGDGAFVAKASTSPSFARSRWEAGALLQRVLKGTPVAVFDVGVVPEWRVQPDSVRSAVCSALHLPLITQRGSAIMIAVHSERAFFSPRHIDLARRFASIAVPFLDGIEARRIEHARQEAERRAEVLEQQRGRLEEQLATIRAQRLEIERLAAPVIQLWDGLLLVPMIGALDADQAEVATERILTAMSTTKSPEVLLDLTGLERADDQLAARLDAIARSVRIMGGTATLSGVSAEMSHHLARLDLGIAHLRTSSTLGRALVRALAALGFEVRRTC